MKILILLKISATKGKLVLFRIFFPFLVLFFWTVSPKCHLYNYIETCLDSRSGKKAEKEGHKKAAVIAWKKKKISQQSWKSLFWAVRQMCNSVHRIPPFHSSSAWKNSVPGSCLLLCATEILLLFEEYSDIMEPVVPPDTFPGGQGKMKLFSWQ